MDVMDNYNPSSKDWHLITPLRIHINQKRTEWLNDVDSMYYKEDTRNYLRVGLYAYNVQDQQWEFFMDNNIYVSGWKKQDNGGNTGSNLYYLGNAYGKDIGYLSLDQNIKKKIRQNFLNRGLFYSETIKDFPYQLYAHSEQALISHLEIELEKENPLKEYCISLGSYKSLFPNQGSIEKLIKINLNDTYKHYFMLIVQTNTPCSNCELVFLQQVKNKKIFEQFLRTNFLSGVFVAKDNDAALIEKQKYILLSLSLYTDATNIINSVLFGDNYILKSNDQYQSH